MRKDETITAIATSAGRGGIGVVRVSGKNIDSLMHGILGKAIKPRTASFGDFLDGDSGVIDRGIALYFPAPHSYTGEDVLELQGHGGQVVLKMLLERCLELGARLAEPGEFTQRAYLNDKLDLAQAESVADLIDASTKNAARGAMRSLQGEFSRKIHFLVNSLIDLRMLVEATLDFPEEDIDFLQEADAFGRLDSIRKSLKEVLRAAHQGNLVRDGAHIVLVGRPNVGKSSLLNRLSGEEIAIVTDIPGTTRDAIRQSIEIEGIPVHIIDTAGLRQTEDAVEKIGIERTRKEIEKADLILYLSDNRSVSSDDEILSGLPTLPMIHVHNKIDLERLPPSAQEKEGRIEIGLSAKTGQGVELLKEKLLQLLGWQNLGEGLFSARKRHIDALNEAGKFLDQASLEKGNIDLFAENLRIAQSFLSRITGEFTPDDLLGEIFARFCIGK